jgi:F0F1-type ATP synthase membrane subunit c/vacuolar-type H+-ATPase subunit K
MNRTVIFGVVLAGLAISAGIALVSASVADKMTSSVMVNVRFQDPVPTNELQSTAMLTAPFVIVNGAAIEVGRAA